MTGIERHTIEENIEEIKDRMKRKNQQPGLVIGRGYGMNRLSKELAYWMNLLEQA